MGKKIKQPEIDTNSIEKVKESIRNNFKKGFESFNSKHNSEIKIRISGIQKQANQGVVIFIGDDEFQLSITIYSKLERYFIQTGLLFTPETLIELIQKVSDLGNEMKFIVKFIEFTQGGVFTFNFYKIER
jgi:hypothetical protein